MRVSDVIAELKGRGHLAGLIRMGVISAKHANFYDINQRYEQLCRQRPDLNRVYNAEEVAGEFRVTIRTVFRARSEMIQPITTD